MPKISIVIPVYNVYEYLDRCLASVAAQTFEGFEAIVVDDGSPDNSRQVYEAYAARDPRFRCVRKENGGVSCARNTGLSMATGDYVLFIDSDDWMPADALETLFRRAEETGADLTIADVTIVHESGVEERVHVFDADFCTGEVAFIDGYRQAILGYAYNPRPYGGRCIMATGLGGPWNKLVRRAFIEEHGLSFDPYVMGIFDDCLFTLGVLAHARSVAYVAKPVYCYRMVASSLLHCYKANMLEVNAHIFERIEAYIASCADPGSFKRAYAFYVTRRFDDSLKSYFFAPDNPKGFGQRLAELRETTALEPYRTAFVDVDPEKLNKSRWAICKQAKRGNAWAIWAIWKAKQVKQRLVSR